MARNPDAIEASLSSLLEKRDQLLAQGLARGMIWREGKVPPGGPNFPKDLTDSLLHFGYGVLALALELRDTNLELESQRYDTYEAFRVAAESIESVFRKGDTRDPSRGLHLVVGSAAFHLAGYAARSFTLLTSPEPRLNLSSAETALGLLLRRELSRLRRHVVSWLADPLHTDESIAKRLEDEEEFSPEDAVVVALGKLYHRALGLADTALYQGDPKSYQRALTLLDKMVGGASLAGNIPHWWVGTLSRHLLRDLWEQSLHKCLPPEPTLDSPGRWSDLRQALIQSLTVRDPPQIDLWPSQLEAAARATDPEDDLVVSLPTSAGKTRIAELCILHTLAEKRRVVYVTPLRALSAQLEETLARTFSPLETTVTSLYGASGMSLIDNKTLLSAEIVVATPEKLDFAIRQDPDVLADVGLVVFDEGHMIGLDSREIRYEVLIQRLLRREDADSRRIVCLSAMFNPDDPAFKDFTGWLRSDEPGEPIHVDWRPTRQRLAFLTWTGETGRLQFLKGERPFVRHFLERRRAAESSVQQRKTDFPQNIHELCIAVSDAFAKDGHSILVYCPERKLVEPLVREFVRMSRQGFFREVAKPTEYCLKVAMAIGKEWLGENHPAVQGLSIGVGSHHGALPSPFLRAVENLLNQGQLGVIVASPTLAQGIDLSCSTLVFRSITRFNPHRGRAEVIKASEFANVIGRVGRAYVDLDGLAVYPSFGKHEKNKGRFEKLASEVASQQLWSGLARLVDQIAKTLSRRLGIYAGDLVEYVLNNQNIWSDQRVLEAGTDGQDEGDEAEFEDQLADLDVALLSLLEPLDASEDNLASMLDAILASSLWQRTVQRLSPDNQKLERGLLMSRAQWLWRTTDAEQRRACFAAGLGKSSGVFLYDHLDSLVGMLARFHAACGERDHESIQVAARTFADFVMQDRFFSVRKSKLPENWEQVLDQWVTGVPVSTISSGQTAGQQGKIQGFLQNGVIFRMVWAAEAVRVQAQSVGHPKASELGDGPSLTLTYGVPTIQAALLCQRGFASRTGALWASTELSTNFTDFAGLRDWLIHHMEVLNSEEFWESPGQYLLWSTQFARTRDQAREWKRRTLQIPVHWAGTPPVAGTTLRIVPLARISHHESRRAAPFLV